MKFVDAMSSVRTYGDARDASRGVGPESSGPSALPGAPLMWENLLHVSTARFDALRALPGIGSYTAAAVASFAFGQRHAVLDTNVRRVLARLVSGQPWAGTASSVSVAERRLAESLLPAEPAVAARWSVAVMELGALVCTAAGPRCGDCPVARECTWLAAGRPEVGGAAATAGAAAGADGAAAMVGAAGAARSSGVSGASGASGVSGASGAARRRTQKYEGTDRQCRGRVLAVLRATDDPVFRADFDAVWAKQAQLDRALDGLVADGLVDPLPDGRFALPGSAPLSR